MKQHDDVGSEKRGKQIYKQHSTQLVGNLFAQQGIALFLLMNEFVLPYLPADFSCSTQIFTVFPKFHGCITFSNR